MVISCPNNEKFSFKTDSARVELRFAAKNYEKVVYTVIQQIMKENWKLNVHHVVKRCHLLVLWKFIIGYTQERNLLNVQNVERSSMTNPCLLDTNKSIK